MKVRQNHILPSGKLGGLLREGPGPPWLSGLRLATSLLNAIPIVHDRDLKFGIAVSYTFFPPFLKILGICGLVGSWDRYDLVLEVMSRPKWLNCFECAFDVYRCHISWLLCKIRLLIASQPTLTSGQILTLNFLGYIIYRSTRLMGQTRWCLSRPDS